MTTFTKGIDISTHQGDLSPVAFSKAAADGIRFCYIKATEGVGYTDPRFSKHLQALDTANVQRRTMGLPPMYAGGYHFARPDSSDDTIAGAAKDGEREARWFARELSRRGLIPSIHPCLPPVLDLEKYSHQGPAGMREWIRAAADVIFSEIGAWPVIYTGRNWWRYETGNSQEFQHLHLWVVRYTAEGRTPGGSFDPAGPMPWDDWTMWQWSGGDPKGPQNFAYGEPVQGMPWPLDLNWFRGSERDLAMFCNDEEGAKAAAITDAAGELDDEEQEDPLVKKLRTIRDFHSSEVVRIEEVLETLGEEP